MSAIDSVAVKELSEEINRKNELLKRLIASYTKAIGFIENRNYDSINSELDIQSKIITEIDGYDTKSSSISWDYASLKKKAAEYFSKYRAADEIYPILNKTAADVETYGRLLKNCGVLCEKLTYLINEVKTESEQFILAQKRRRKIDYGYNNSYTHKAGAIIDYKSN
jgi:hypothetical protein